MYKAQNKYSCPLRSCGNIIVYTNEVLITSNLKFYVYFLNSRLQLFEFNIYKVCMYAKYARKTHKFPGVLLPVRIE